MVDFNSYGLLSLVASLLCWHLSMSSAAAAPVTKDVIIYGSTPAAITAAIQVKRMGRSVAIVYPSPYIGGLTTNGLSWTDSKNGTSIGGIAREFYQNIYTYYDTSDTSIWKFGQSRADYVKVRPSAQPGKTVDDTAHVQWTFEPRVAQTVFDKMLADEKIELHPGEYLDRKAGVTKEGTKITKICMLSGNCYLGKQFIDAGYEGDLMDTAGISSTTGRDARNVTQEQYAGMLLPKTTSTYGNIDPYVEKGKSSSGLLPGIEAVVSDPFTQEGWEDTLRLQPFIFRLTVTDYSGNFVPIEKPASYDESRYELLLRLHEANKTVGFTQSQIPNRKGDANSIAGMSLDYLGGVYSLPGGYNFATASYEQRLAMHKAQKEYQQGLLYTLTHSARINSTVKAQYAKWGLSKDEFPDNDHWPRQIYVREARRMQSNFTMALENVNRGAAGYHGKSAIVGMGCYNIDSHTVRRVVQGGKIYDEGFLHIDNHTPYPIPYEALYPYSSQATNFLNPVTLSATHVALGSIRMEPTYMILGQSAAIAAVHAIEQNVAVQNIDQMKLQAAVTAAKQVTSL